MRYPEHGRWDSDLLLVLYADLRTDFFFFFGKGEQVWKWLFPLLEDSPERGRADGAVRCTLYTDITNRQKAPCTEDSRNTVNILIARTLEQICCCPMHVAFTYSFPPSPCWGQVPSPRSEVSCVPPWMLSNRSGSEPDSQEISACGR